MNTGKDADAANSFKLSAIFFRRFHTAVTIVTVPSRKIAGKRFAGGLSTVADADETHIVTNP